MPSKNSKQTVQKTETSTPVAPAKVVEQTAAPVAAQKGGKKVAPKKEETPVVAAAAAPAVVAAAPTPAQKGGKKTAAPKKEKAAAPKKEKADAEEAEDEEEAGGRRIRSFKVQLPNKEDYEGRFTGLTPYQAANKALSKYFRETKDPMVEVTFSICESTRKSKKSVYTYVGKRLKLETPVTYQIQDGREIVKNFKNSLKKVKKSETKSSA